MAEPGCDLSVIIPVQEHAEHLAGLLPQVHSALQDLSLRYELVLVAAQEHDRLRQVAGENRAVLLLPAGHGYGAALLAGLQQAAGEFSITMDADQAHPASFLSDLWKARELADVVIASRYIPGGRADMPRMRTLLSRGLNIVFSRGLDLHVRDMSSGFRLYRTRIVQDLQTQSQGYDILQEILVQVLMAGHRIGEIPFTYVTRSRKSSLARLFNFGLAYLGTFARLWGLRNSIASADYDSRAYDALMPPQRYWQRQRFRLISRLLAGQGRCLDVGCGSSRILESLPPGSLALDILMRKLRFARRYGRPLVQGSIFALPVGQASFACVTCSQVIEHVPRPGALSELDRVLAPGGLLILGTPDYGTWEWRVIEWLYKRILPQAYADEHITHYTCKELTTEFVEKRGYRLESRHYILHGELILGLRKPAFPAAGAPNGPGPGRFGAQVVPS